MSYKVSEWYAGYQTCDIANNLTIEEAVKVKREKIKNKKPTQLWVHWEIHLEKK